MRINRKIYLDRLISRIGNGMIKVVTGVRRSGKSYLLFNIFSDYLKLRGTDDSHIIAIKLDDWENHALCDPDSLYSYVKSRIVDNKEYFLLLDEIQLVPQFEFVLNGLHSLPCVDIYVTGSNAKFLSKDIITEFRGRGDEIKIRPLSFSEYMSVYVGDRFTALNEYMTYGGLPQIVSFSTEEQKSEYLKGLFTETYLRDITERYGVRQDGELAELVTTIASSIGGLTNPARLANTFESVKNVRISPNTVKLYIDYLCDSFLVEQAMRYDVKGRKYIGSPSKYYFVDCGLRNARLNFRQLEMTHLMENVIYNELRVRGFNVDVGCVVSRETDVSGKRVQRQLEVDFVCNQGSRRYYVQSAYRLGSDDKERQEKSSLINIGDSFKKIIITGEPGLIQRDEYGITTISVYDFLLRQDSLEL